MVLDDALIPNVSEMPKFTNAFWQLNRIEALIDSAMRSYANIYRSDTDRNQFASAIEMLFLALSPRLTDQDRKVLRSFIYRIRIQVRAISAPSMFVQSRQGSNLELLRHTGMSVLEVILLVKEKKGLGIPSDEKVEWAEQYAAATDTAITPEELETKAGKSEAEKIEEALGDEAG